MILKHTKPSSARLRAIILTAVLALSTSVMAQNINMRIHDAHLQIDKGVHTGQLTASEASRLKNEFSAVLRDENRALRDGRLNHSERERLDHELKRLESHIDHLKHNGQRDDKGHESKEHDSYFDSNGRHSQSHNYRNRPTSRSSGY